MHLASDVRVLVLIALANGAPMFAKTLLPDRFVWPLDFGVVLPDGQRLFGASKTIRGVLGILAGVVCGPVLGLGVGLGAAAGAAAMAGDLLSSFIKRRMTWPPSSRALGLDQIPEALFPALVCALPFGLTVTDLALIVVLFFVGELWISRVLFRLRLRDRPY